MGITAKWDDQEQTVLVMAFTENWTLDELRQVGMDALLMLRTVSHPVYVVSDFLESTGVPSGVLWQARDLHQLRPSNWEAGITVSTDAYARDLLALFGEVYMGSRRDRLYIVGSREEAIHLINGLKSEERTS